MFRNFALCATFALSAFAAPTSPFEVQLQLVNQAILNAQREARLQEVLKRRDFESKFNQLIRAVSDFSKSYNEGKGAVWPRAEAEKLSRAMRQLQSTQKSLRTESPASNRQPTRKTVRGN